jgi:hypothetical protein
MRKHGASAKAYNDRTKKRVYLWIDTTTKWDPLHVYAVEKSVSVFDKKYVFIAGNLCSRVQWQSSEAVTIDFYDFGDKVDHVDARKTGMPSNHIATLTLQFDKQTGRFVERK